jgi:excinuclease ABC subunit C
MPPACAWPSAHVAVRRPERDPAAVTALRAELERRRDRAAAELRFEFAAKLQDEIAAIEWIVADQKASWLEPHDADVCGWADGVLVRFEVRAGRMSTWTQRATSEEAARDRVAATPLLWRAFAQRPAELAAQLLRD